MTDLSGLKPDPRNARRRTDRSATLIAESLQRFGAARSIVIDEDGRILAGNGTVEGAKAAGISNLRIIESDGDELIAVRRTGLTEEQKVGLALADNRTSDLSEWDADMLQQLSAEQDLAPWFDADDLAALLGETEQVEAEGLTDPHDVPEPPAEPVTKPGDIWLLGKHRVMCGDSTAITSVERLMAGQQADMVFTDPPYNVAVCGGTHDPRDKKNYGKGPKIANDSMSDGDFKAFLLEAFSCIYAVTKPGAALYVAHADSEGINFRCSFKESGFLLKQCLIWVKQQFVFGRSDYHWQHEPILYGWKDGAAHEFYGERNQGTTWQIDRPMRSEKEHPTQKPVAIPLKAIENSSKPGALLYEPFLGSGSTLLASEQSGRRCYGMELSPNYCDVIVKRWQAFTGKTATLEATGEPFPSDD